MELTAPPPKKTKPASEERRKLSLGSVPQSVRPNMQPQRRFSHAGFGMQGGQAPMVVEAKRKISLFHNMKFNPIMEEQNHQEQAQKKEYGLNPNAPSFSMQQQQMYPQQQWVFSSRLWSVKLETVFQRKYPLIWELRAIWAQYIYLLESCVYTEMRMIIDQTKELVSL